MSGRPVGGPVFAEEIAESWRLDLYFRLTPVDQQRCADLSHGGFSFAYATRQLSGFDCGDALVPAVEAALLR